MRRIKIGDRVQAFLDSRVIGTVTNIIEDKNVPWMVGGTASTKLICEIKLDDGAVARYDLHELYLVDL
jgi:hypothetical protein